MSVRRDCLDCGATDLFARDRYSLIRESGGVTRRAHRVAYELLVGPIPDGLQRDHLCHTRDLGCAGGRACLHRRCVNPCHLEPVTSGENSGRAAVGGRARIAAEDPLPPAYSRARRVIPRQRRMRAAS